MFTWKYTKLSTGSKTNHDNCLIPPLSLPLSQSLHLKVKQDYTGPVNMKQEVHTARTASRCNCGKDYSRKRFKPWWRYVGFKKKKPGIEVSNTEKIPIPLHLSSSNILVWKPDMVCRQALVQSSRKPQRISLPSPLPHYREYLLFSLSESIFTSY